jgi:chorismate mutase / prephenate dehydratase
MSDLLKLRAEIDAIDDEILKLVSARGRIAERVAHAKEAAGEATTAAAIYRPEREAQILRRVTQNNPGPLPNDAITRIHRAVIGACMALEAPLRVAFLGPRGTFSEAAAQKHFGGAAVLVPCATFDEVFRACEREETDFAVVPVVNSSEGFVGRTLDLAVNSPLKVCGEIDFRVKQNVLVRPGTPLTAIKTVVSHPQSLAQCAVWLSAHLPQATRETAVSNAEAARFASERDHTAAIAGEGAAAEFGLEICAAGIEDNPNNTTRFWLMGRRDVPPSGADKTSIAIATQHISGAVVHAIEPFANHAVSMAHIESRPMPGNQWEYVFLIDVEGHATDRNVSAALNEVRERARFFKLLGAYPKAIL